MGLYTPFVADYRSVAVQPLLRLHLNGDKNDPTRG